MYFAVSPDISIIPSWNPTILPTVTTAAPTRAWVLPLPTPLTFPITPGKIHPGPDTLTLGSITSFTGAILIDSPGLASSIVTLLILSSDIANSSSSFLFIIRVPFLISVLSPNLMSLM